VVHQTRALAALRLHLAYAVACVPYYRARAAHYDPDRASSWAAFSRVPLLTRDDVRAALPLELLADHVDVRAGLADGTLERLHTSGTGGERLSVVADAHHRGVPADDLALYGAPPSARLQRLAVLASPECLGRACDGTYASRLRQDGAQLILPSTDEPLLFDEDLARVVVDELARFDAGELFASPVHLHALVRACRAHDLPLPRLELVLLTYQYATQCQRRAIERAFPTAVVRSLYGASELGNATPAVECLRGRLHVQETECFVEIVDGHVVLTTLGNLVTPLVRYRIGDLGALVDAPCDCPLAGAPTLVHHGRARDRLVVDGRTFTTRDVDLAIGAPVGLDAWQLVHGGGGDLELRLVPALDAAPDVDAVVDAVARSVGRRPRARVVDVIDAEPSGKIAHTRDDVVRAQVPLRAPSR